MCTRCKNFGHDITEYRRQQRDNANAEKMKKAPMKKAKKKE